MSNTLELTRRMLDHGTCPLTANRREIGLTPGDRVLISISDTINVIGLYVGKQSNDTNVYLINGKISTVSTGNTQIPYPNMDEIVPIDLDIIELNQWVINSQGIFDSLDCPRPVTWYDLMLQWHMFTIYNKRFSNTEGWVTI